MSAVQLTPPKPVQRWKPDDYAVKGRCVSELARPVIDLLAPRQGERVLDLGCGDGVLTQEIAARGADVLGADLSDELLAAAAAKGLNVQSVDGHALPFKDEFDAVFTNASLHWMHRPELVIAGVRRALRPRGRFAGEFGAHGNVAAIATAIPRGQCPAWRRSRQGRAVVLSLGRRISQAARAGGFAVKTIMLVALPTTLDIGIKGWLETFGRSFFDQFGEPERGQVFAEVIELLRPALCDADGVWTAEHIRLRFAAERVG